MYDQLKAKLIQDVEQEASKPSTWTLITGTQQDNFSVKVYRKSNSGFVFRVDAELEGTPETAFDLLSDIEQRSRWDDMCESGYILEEMPGGTQVVCMTTKGYWPTAPRDALLVSFLQKTATGYVYASQSIDDHPEFIEDDSHVRMIARIAAQVVMPHPDSEHRCKVVQIVDGDLGGWIPSSLVTLLSTQVLPISMRRANKLLKSMPQKTESSMIKASLIPAPISITPMVTANETLSPTIPVAKTAIPKKPLVKKKSLLSWIHQWLLDAQPWMVAFLVLKVLYRSWNVSANCDKSFSLSIGINPSQTVLDSQSIVRVTAVGAKNSKGLFLDLENLSAKSYSSYSGDNSYADFKKGVARANISIPTYANASSLFRFAFKTGKSCNVYSQNFQVRNGRVEGATECPKLSVSIKAGLFATGRNITVESNWPAVISYDPDVVNEPPRFELVMEGKATRSDSATPITPVTTLTTPTLATHTFKLPTIVRGRKYWIRANRAMDYWGYWQCRASSAIALGVKASK